MQLVFLGTGTSTGVPVIGCRCPVCSSPDPRNRRTRASLLVLWAGRRILIDTATELRLQAVAAGLESLDTVLFTHAHADHVMGFDDLRRFNQIQGKAIPVFGSPQTLETLRGIFSYAFSGPPDPLPGFARPAATLHPVEGPFEAAGLPVQPVPVFHGRLPVLGYRLGPVAYVTDCSRIPTASRELLEGLELLVLGALRFRPHPTHLTIDQALEVIEALRPRRALLTHLCHEVDHAELERSLPPGVAVAYDGLKVGVPLRGEPVP